MAVISKNGLCLATIEYPFHRVKIFLNKKVLKNYGTGWKLSHRIKDGITCEQSIGRRIATIARHCENSDYKEFFDTMLKIPLKTRMVLKHIFSDKNEHSQFSDMWNDYQRHIKYSSLKSLEYEKFCKVATLTITTRETEKT